VAVMGCPVNGPGEAKEADIGVAGGKGTGLIFKKGKAVKKVPADKIMEELVKEVFNLAAEEYLFSERQDDILFLYVNEPSVIIGSNQVIRNEVNLNFCAENNIRVVRRMSGGGAVYHDLGNLNYCFITNKTEGKSLLSADFLLPVVETLKLLNVPVEIGKRKDLWLQGGFKVSGTASHVSKNRELHHGTLLYDTDLDKLQKSLTVEDKDESLKGIVSVPSVVKNLKNSLQENQESSVFFNWL